MNIKQIETSSCSTKYLVNWNGEDFTLNLGTIIGGTPSLEFSDYSFSERYPVVAKWDNSHWMKKEGRYDHQDKYAIQGPTLEVLPEGEKTMEQFLEKYVPLKKLRNMRYKNLPVGEEFLHVDKNLMSVLSPYVKSRRARDTDNQTYVHFQFDLTPYRFGVVTAHSAVYSGPCTDFASPWWKKYDTFVRGLKNNDMRRYELLTDAEYEQLCSLLSEGIANKEFVKV